MVSRGSAFDKAPDACPFIALELDRDRRSERPDYRHRCYAEQVPAPRTIAHQERYCLSPNFSGCPIFQDWALRAAARPVPLPPGYEGRRSPDAARAAASAAAAAGIASNVAEAQQWPDSMDSASAAAAAAAAESAADKGGTEQLGVFDAPPESIPPPAPLAPLPTPEPEVEPEPHASPAFEAEEAAEAAAAAGGVGFAAVDPPHFEEPEPIPSSRVADDAGDESGDSDLGDAAVPAFLAARSARPASTPAPRPDGPVTREEVVPSWELTDRYGAQSSGRGSRGDGGGSSDGTFGKILTAVAILIILALGIAAVVLIPGLLNGPGATQRPTLALASRTPGSTLVAVQPSPTTTTRPTVTIEPTAEPTPGPTPRSYRVKAGDTLAKIAKKFKITVAALTAANPELENADHIEVGQILIIPPREPS